MSAMKQNDNIQPVAQTVPPEEPFSAQGGEAQLLERLRTGEYASLTAWLIAYWLYNTHGAAKA